MHRLLCLALILIGLPVAAAAQSFSCSGDATAQAERELAGSESAERAAVDRTAAQAALAKIDALRRDLDDGKPLPEPYGAAGLFAVLAHSAKDPVLVELFRRAAMDQFGRASTTASATHTGWAVGLSAAANAYAFSVSANRDVCGVDEANTAWLERQIDAHGWFKGSVYGQEAATAAFVLTQHADLNKPFQKKVLAMMEPLLATNDVRPQNYALLFDRVAVGEGRPQRYGSQGGCTGPGQWTEKPVEDAATLDQTRAKVGLEPMAAYRARFVAWCVGAAPKG
jgi:hypothetical protein